MATRKIAVIDLGTNTFHLLIIETESDGYKVLFKKKTSVKIGQGGITKGVISPEAFDRAFATLSEFREKMDEFGVNEIFATGTSAIRSAKNGEDFIREIKNRFDISVHVISGEREAELIYHGVKNALNLGIEKSLIMDIGGGSVEFIICNSDKIFWKESFEIGAQRMLDLFIPSDPIQKDQVSQVVNYLEEKLPALTAAVQNFQPDLLVGSSGTFDTLADIDSLRKGISLNDKQKEYDLPLDSFRQTFQEVLKKNRAERMVIPGMIEMRVDMIVVACILINYIVEKYQLEKIRVSAYALKEGVLSKAINYESIS
ncbi:MAG: phosphatase [Sporocytophaga sp.]|uniref:Ppx/GppA phosphatase family protein n=1 Tax=Sporocytophaga sp. TaxID=2231183 RepID=UPI001B1247B0|nr:phosphatase [Sporocytophaga sp.]MBO9702265.1 phosphatase [Sporocytophaga sp.]